MKKNVKTVAQKLAEMKANRAAKKEAVAREMKALKKELSPETMDALEPYLEKLVDLVDSDADYSEVIEGCTELIGKIAEVVGVDEEAADASLVKTFGALQKKVEEMGEKSVSKTTIAQAVNTALKEFGGNFDGINAKINIGKKDVELSPSPVGGHPAPEFVGVIEQIILSGNLSSVLNVGSTNKQYGSITATRELSDTEFAEQQNLGDKKSELSAKYVSFDVSVKTFAGWLKVAKQILNDVGWLENTIVNLMARKARKAWEKYLFGVASSSGTLYDGTTMVGEVQSAQMADAIFALATQLRSQGFDGNIAVVLNPKDEAKLRSIKNKNDDYMNTDPVMAGITVSPNPEQTVGQMTVGDFSYMDALANMTDATAKILDQNEDDAVRNMVTIIAEFFGCAWLSHNEAFITADIQSVVDAILIPTTPTSGS